MVDLDQDLLTAAVQRLTTFPELVELVDQGLIGKEQDGTPWLFQGLNDEGRPYRDPEGSGTGIVVLSENTQWANNAHNTAQFPLLQMLIYMDSTRNADGSPAILDAYRKLKHVSKRLDRCFHIFDTLNADRAWPGPSGVTGHPLWVFYSRRSQNLSIRSVPGTQNLTIRGELLYETSTD